MVQIKAFSYNPNAQYQPSGVYKTKDPDIINQTIEVKQPPDSGSSLKANFSDVFDKNMLPYVESYAIVRAWNYTPMRFWQNQLNFAVWCATSGCGVSYEDHLSGDIPRFAKSMFIFHVYYQIRRIIFELKAPLLTAQSWNAFDNSFDKKSYEKICAEFNVDNKTPTGARSLMQMVVLVLLLIKSPAHGISHSMAFYMMLIKCRSPNTTKESFISTISLSSIAMRGQRSYLIGQTVLQDQALSISMNQSTHIVGQSLVLNIRSNQISSGLGAHLMRRNNFLLILKMQSKPCGFAQPDYSIPECTQICTHQGGLCI